MKYSFILIDLDQTIFDFKQAEKMALGRTIKAFGLEPTEEVIRRYEEINRGLITYSREEEKPVEA